MPAEFILSTQAPQHPQVSVRLTTKASRDARVLGGKEVIASVPIRNFPQSNEPTWLVELVGEWLLEVLYSKDS